MHLVYFLATWFILSSALCSSRGAVVGKMTGLVTYKTGTLISTLTSLLTVGVGKSIFNRWGCLRGWLSA